MIKVGLFIIPDHKTNELIYFHKQNIIKKFGVRPFSNHPPHITLFTIDLSYFKKNYSDITEIINSYKKKPVKSSQNFVFYNDLLLKNHNTFVIKVENFNWLRDMQKKLILNFQNERTYQQKIKKENLDDKMLENLNKFGFPFIGSNWIPHITIGALKNNKKELNFISHLLEHPIVFKFNFTQLNIYLINDLNITLLKKFKI